MLFEERKSGVLLHPTSLPSVYGIGDFGAEARRFVDTLEEAGQSLWQILPLVPIGYGNSPYQSTSAFAGNILLISPDELVEMGLLTEEDLGEIPAFDKERVDYDAVKAYKLPLLHKAYETFCAKADEDMQADFAAFCEKQDMWLADFALFTALQAHFRAERAKGIDEEEYLAFAVDTIDFLTEEQQKDYFESACWNTWPRTLRKRNAASLKKWTRLLADAIEEEKFYQYLFFTQWQALKAYANEKGISIMGDTPIFMAYDSADVWANQKLFQLDSMGFPTVVAGVPPDYFCAEGQLWGNPLYDWKAHKKTGYLWWTERIHKALEDVDYLRIDHFRAFESHWEVKFGAENAIVGEWKKGPGMDFFNTIEKTLGKLPLIAEDLGIITDEVRALREEAGFPGMRVLQFAFGNDKNNAYLPHSCDKNSVMYSGTHDNDTALGWLATAPEKDVEVAREYLHLDAAEGEGWGMMRAIWSSVADLSIVTMQDVLGLGSDARINTPSTLGGNWCWRALPGYATEQVARRLHRAMELYDRLPKAEVAARDAALNAEAAAEAWAAQSDARVQSSEETTR